MLTTNEKGNDMATATLVDSKGNDVILDVPVNVKVRGEKAMRKGVTLAANDGESVRVLTGKRGRPATLPVEQIEKTRAL